MGGLEETIQYQINEAIGFICRLDYQQLKDVTSDQSTWPAAGASDLEQNIEQSIEQSIEYHLDEPLPPEQFYGPHGEYATQFLRPHSVQEEVYQSTAAPQDISSESMTAAEAEETIQELQYAAVLGTLSEVSYVQRRRFALWADLHKAELALFHRLNAMTNDVDYSRVF